MTHEEVPLFDFDEPASTLLADIPIRREQILEIQAAFAAAEIVSASEQRRIIQNCTIRQVVALDELLAKEARPVLKRIAEHQRSRVNPPVRGSAWDTREGDTWIDKL